MAQPLFAEPQKKKQLGDALALALMSRPASADAQSVTGIPYGSDALMEEGLPRADTGLTDINWVDYYSPAGVRPIAYGNDMRMEDAGWAGVAEPGVFGQMTQGERDALGSTKTGMGLTNLGVGLMGGPSPFGPIGMTLSGILAADALGVHGNVRGVTSLSPSEVQSMNDRYGYGWDGTVTATDPQAANFGFGGYNRGDLDYGGLMGGGGDGAGSSAGDSPGGLGGGVSGGGEARGGAHYAAPGRERVSLYGEAGPEVGIFVPEFMRQPGLQGKEAQVRSALKRALLTLR